MHSVDRHVAIALATITGPVMIDRFMFAHACKVNQVWIDTFYSEIVAHNPRAAVRQFVIVVNAANLVGVAINQNAPDIGVSLQVFTGSVQCLLPLARQSGFVTIKIDRVERNILETPLQQLIIRDLQGLLRRGGGTIPQARRRRNGCL